MTYDPTTVAAYFDALGQGEWERFEQTLSDQVSLALHTRALERFVAPGSRVLDIGAGPGRFTEVLHRLGCRIVVADLSGEQLAWNRKIADSRGFAQSVESWQQLDICQLDGLEDSSFDAVVAFGGPLSYVFDQRDVALAECRRVLRPGGVLLLSVMSLWGSLRRHLDSVLGLPLEANRQIIATGDLTQAGDPDSTHHCHMFRADELRAFLDRPGLELAWMSAAGSLATLHPASLAEDPERWDALLEFEEAACSADGMLDAGTHLIAIAHHVRDSA
jgi:SAM-dependent methyltransferase